MTEYEFELDLEPSNERLDQLTAGLQEHAAEFVSRPGFEPIALFARDPQGILRGGIYGRINWRWLSISLLWVSPEVRGSGLGTTLLQRLEHEARDRGCTRAHIDTFSYQAHRFYLANDYVEFAELPDYAEGHSRIYLQKSL